MKRTMFLLLICAVMALCSCSSRAAADDGEESEKVLFLTNAGHSSMAVSEDGYYFVAGARVYVADKALNNVVPLCNKADCNHDPGDLNAAVFCNSHCPVSYIAPYVRDGYLYMMGQDGQYGGIYRMRTDGSGSELWIKLYEFIENYEPTAGFLNYIFSQERCYYSYCFIDEQGLYHNQILQVELKTGAKEEVFAELPFDRQVMPLFHMDINDGRMACSTMTENFEKMVFVWDLESGECVDTLQGADDAFLLNDGIYYSIPGKGILYKTFADMTEEMVIPFDNEIGPVLGIDRDHIYLDWSRSGQPYYTYGKVLGPEDYHIDVYTHDGELVTQLDTSFVEDKYGKAIMCADGRYIFLGESAMLFYDVYALDQSSLGDENAPWKKLNMSGQ